MSGLTTDPADSCLDEIGPSGQQECYLVLSEEERAKGFVRPLRRSYIHIRCGSTTTMAQVIAETYAREPTFYNGTYCASGGTHFPLLVANEPQFIWIGTDEEGVGS